MKTEKLDWLSDEQRTALLNAGVRKINGNALIESFRHCIHVTEYENYPHQERTVYSTGKGKNLRYKSYTQELSRYLRIINIIHVTCNDDYKRRVRGEFIAPGYLSCDGYDMATL